jgi:hypothetical protein
MRSFFNIINQNLINNKNNNDNNNYFYEMCTIIE